MFYSHLKITITAMLLLLFAGSSGCMMSSPYASQVQQQQQVRAEQLHQQQQLQARQLQTRKMLAQQQRQSGALPPRLLALPQSLQLTPLQPIPQPQFLLTQHPSQSTVPIYPAPRVPTSVHSAPARSVPSPITQVAYSDLSLNTKNTAQDSNRESPELLQPWNLNEFKNKKPIQKNSSTSSYQLVSDTQETNSNRNAPPPMNQDWLTLLPKQPRAQSQSLSTSSASSWSEKMPILNLGRNLVKEFKPSNDRKWSQNHAVLQNADFNGNRVTVHNVRYSKYETSEQYTTQYYDATFNLDEIRTIDLIVVPFRGIPRLAHVESSFGFADGRYLAMSIEARYEEGEKYDPLGAGLRQFELIYVFTDERDMIRLGTDVSKNDVHIYRLKFEPNEVQKMFVDALQRANQLAEKPEFYHPLTNSCVTNLITHINKGRPKSIPKEYRTLLPGLMDHYVYDLKLIDTNAKTFQEAKENAKVNWLVEKFDDLEYFSAGIRQNMY